MTNFDAPYDAQMLHLQEKNSLAMKGAQKLLDDAFGGESGYIYPKTREVKFPDGNIVIFDSKSIENLSDQEIVDSIFTNIIENSKDTPWFAQASLSRGVLPKSIVNRYDFEVVCDKTPEESANYINDTTSIDSSYKELYKSHIVEETNGD